MTAPGKKKLFVLWTSADPDVARKMVFIYCYNSMKNGWWDELRICVWGPSAKLYAENAELQEFAKGMMELGVEFEACQWCTDEYGVTMKLLELDVDVRYMGEPTTERLQSGDWVTLTF